MNWLLIIKTYSLSLSAGYLVWWCERFSGERKKRIGELKNKLKVWGWGGKEGERSEKRKERKRKEEEEGGGREIYERE